MGTLEVYFERIYGVLRNFNWITDLIDIVVIAFIIYKAIQMVRETRAGQLIKGLILMVLFYFVSLILSMKTTSYLLEGLFSFGVILLVVLFQPEIRRALEKVGRANVPSFSILGGDSHEKGTQIWEKPIQEICKAAESLAQTKTGALIVIERKTRLGEQIDTGVELNAVTSEELLGNIFFVNTPLHDGAVIVRDGVILAAACFLPKPQKEEFIASNFGARHRAAIGISEISDALTIVISEETGTISVTEDGQMVRNFTRISLAEFLTDKLTVREPEEGGKRKLFRKGKKNEK